jgi:hypothetical protein
MFDDVQYLDLDGDGVPDAVRTTRTRSVASGTDGLGQAIEITEQLASHIDVDGVPASIQVVETHYAPRGAGVEMRVGSPSSQQTAA